MIRSKEERGEGNTVERNTYEQGLLDAFTVCDVAMAALSGEGQRVDGGRVCVRLLHRRLVELGYAAPRPLSLDHPLPPQPGRALYRAAPPAPPVDQVQAMRDRIAAASAAAAAAGEAHQRVVDDMEKRRREEEAAHAPSAEQCRVDAEKKARRRITFMEVRRAKEQQLEPILSGVTPQTNIWDAFSRASVRLWSRLEWLDCVSDEATLSDLAAINVNKFVGRNCSKGTLGELRQVLSSAGLWLVGDEEIDMRDEQ